MILGALHVSPTGPVAIPQAPGALPLSAFALAVPCPEYASTTSVRLTPQPLHGFRQIPLYILRPTSPLPLEPVSSYPIFCFYGRTYHLLTHSLFIRHVTVGCQTPLQLKCKAGIIICY